MQPKFPEPTMTPQAATSEPLTNSDLKTILDEAPPQVWWRRPILWIAVGLVVLVGVGLYYWQVSAKSNAAPVYVTESVNRGNLTLTVAANGTLQPTRSVSIGSELSGTVLRVLVDVNDKVKKGQVLWNLIPPNSTIRWRARALRSAPPMPK
jgi:HlyD family secretion protein